MATQTPAALAQNFTHHSPTHTCGQAVIKFLWSANFNHEIITASSRHLRAIFISFFLHVHFCCSKYTLCLHLGQEIDPLIGGRGHNRINAYFYVLVCFDKYALIDESS